jgi:ribulose kinase
MWLKRNLPEQSKQTAKLLDLADFMGYRASGNDLRSVCTMACKWTYLAHEKRWSLKLFKEIGLEDLADNHRIGIEMADGGGTNNPIWLREHADITDCEMVLTKEPEAVLLGSAILAAAVKIYPTIQEAMSSMSEIGTSIPARKEMRSYHDLKYRVFHEMYIDQLKYEQMMERC